MKAQWLIVMTTALILGMAGSAYAGGDVAAGTAKAKKCVACHGADGKGKKNNPPLTGTAEADFVKAMADYKTGARKHAMMNALSKKLSDEDIADLAAYYASLK
jgi:cytochrome c553